MVEAGTNFSLDAFKPVHTDKGVLAYIDVLGTSKLNDAQLENLYSLLRELGPASSGVPNTDGSGHVSNALANTLLIGDAICVTQKYSGPSGESAVATTAGFISSNLFANNYPNRGVLARGSFRVLTSAQGQHQVFGRAVIAAVKHERSLKSTGLVIHDSITNDEVAKWQLLDTGDGFWLSNKIFGQRYLTFHRHFENWRAYTMANRMAHAYSTAAWAITDGHKDWQRYHRAGDALVGAHGASDLIHIEKRPSLLTWL